MTDARPELLAGTGSLLAAQLHDLIQRVEAAGIVSGSPGFLAAAPAEPFTATEAASKGVGGLRASEAGLLRDAIAQSNAAATNTPSAAAGTPTIASTPIATIEQIAAEVTCLPFTPWDVWKFETGAQATLHWWGWSLELDQSSTDALENLLAWDLHGLLGVAAALAPVSAPLAAIEAIMRAAAVDLDDWIAAEDVRHNGIVIENHLWVGCQVRGV